MWNLHILTFPVWIFTNYSGFLPQFKYMHVRLIGHSKLTIGGIVTVNGCLSICVVPAIDWQPIQTYTAFHPVTVWIHPSIPAIFYHAGCEGSLNRDLPLPSHLFWLICGNTQRFPVQVRDLISPACTRSAMMLDDKLYEKRNYLKKGNLPSPFFLCIFEI